MLKGESPTMCVYIYVDVRVVYVFTVSTPLLPVGVFTDLPRVKPRKNTPIDNRYR